MMLPPYKVAYVIDPGIHGSLEKIRGILQDNLGVPVGYIAYIERPPGGELTRSPIERLMNIGHLLDPGDVREYRRIFIYQDWMEYVGYERALDPVGREVKVPRKSFQGGATRLLRHLMGSAERLIEVHPYLPDSARQSLRSPESDLGFYRALRTFLYYGEGVLKELVREYIDSLTDKEFLADFPIPESRNIHAYAGKLVFCPDCTEGGLLDGMMGQSFIEEFFGITVRWEL